MYARRFYRRRARKYLRKGKTGGKRSRAVRSTVSAKVKKYVKSAIHRNIENKMRYNYAANQPIQTGQNSTMTWPLIPSGISVGVYAGDRIGNCIKPVKGIWKCNVNLLPYDATNNNQPRPVWVKIWVVRDLKNAGQLATMDSTSFVNFFNGNNTSLPFQNNTLDTVFDVNTDNFRVLTTRMFKLGCTSMYNVAPLPNTTTSYLDNSVMAKSITIDYTKYVRKQLKYQDNVSGLPNNDNLYFVIQAVACDGSSSLDQRMIEMHYTNRFYYEDA